MDNVIVLDDDEDPATITEAAAATDKKSDSEVTDFIDLVEEPSNNSKCINYMCKTKEENARMTPAPLVCMSYYMNDTKSKRAQNVCEMCFDEAVEHFSKLADAYENEKAMFDVPMPLRNKMVQIGDSDSDDEETEQQQAYMEGEQIDFVMENLPGIMAQMLTDPKLDTQIELDKTVLNEIAKSFDESFDEVTSMIKSMRKDLDRMMFETSESLKPIITELEPLEIVDEVIETPVITAIRQSPRLALVGDGGVPEGPADQPKYLPKNGIFIRKPFVAGELCYAKRPTGSGAWIKVRVVGTNPSTASFNCAKLFTVLDLVDNTRRLVNDVELAYLQPAQVALNLGVRVLATISHSLSRKNIMFPGVIGEPLSPYNRYRYLIFFEDGYASYVEHLQVVPVYRQSDYVWDDIIEESRPFIRKYLGMYPDRPMVMYEKGQSCKTECNGKWWTTRVLQIDCSLVQVSYTNGKKPEWIYRGSNRLSPIFEEERAANSRSINKQRTPRKHLPSGQYVQYTRGDEPPLDPAPLTAGTPPSGDVTTTTTDQRIPAVTSATPVPSTSTSVAPACTAVVRSTARKSTRPPPTAINHASIIDVASVIGPVRSFLPAGGVRVPPPSKIVYYKPRKQSPNPKQFRPHRCTAKCKDRWTCSLTRLRGYSPLSKPLICGFYRLDVRQKGKKSIYYKAPCGRTLRNMKEVHKYLTLTESQLTVDLFNFDHFIRCLAEFQIQPNNPIIKDLSMGQEQVQIPVVNNVDSDFLNFCNYSTRRNPMEGVNLNVNPEFLCGCDCLDDCADKTKCACWKLTQQCLKYMDKDTNADLVGYNYRRLLEGIMTGIYECNSRCKCKKTCLNRLVQHGLQHKLQVFKTENRGWGIRCLNDIPMGTFICIYAGALLTEQMANEGGKSYGDEYFAELDYIETAEQFKDDYEEEVMKLDDEDKEEDHVSDEEEQNLDDDLNVSMYKPDKDFRTTARIHNTGSTEDNIRTRLRNRKKAQAKSASLIEKNNPTDAKSKPTASAVPTDDDSVVISDDEEREPSSFNPKASSDPDDGDSRPSVRKMYGKDEMVYVMDAKNTGNIGRFLNHSCAPNVFVQNVFVDTHDPRFPWVCFFAQMYIRAGSELTWNYNYDIGSVPNKQLLCNCAAPNCKGRLL